VRELTWRRMVAVHEVAGRPHRRGRAGPQLTFCA
jgi:hypothetical protein